MSMLKAAFYGARSSILHSRTKGIRERIFATRYYTNTYTKAENYEKSSQAHIRAKQTQDSGAGKYHCMQE